MFIVDAHFIVKKNAVEPEASVNFVVHQWRDNGQIIGREVAITRDSEKLDRIIARVIIPEEDSLIEIYQSPLVTEALAMAKQFGVAFEGYEFIGEDFNSTPTAVDDRPAFHILFTTHLDSCSPVYDGEVFQPIPLYRLENGYALSKRILRWQENWQACDQLQMSGKLLEKEALAQISEVDSELGQEGRAICQAIEEASQIPTFYYLYRLGSDEAVEHHRRCPVCEGEWKLAEPLHDIFHFKCDKCRLVSNLSWEVDH